MSCCLDDDGGGGGDGGSDGLGSFSMLVWVCTGRSSNPLWGQGKKRETHCQ